jgi:UTP--glucose-1-phosphate uridylyltransferase
LYRCSFAKTLFGELLEGSSSAYRVHNMVEKPTPTEAPSNLAIIGRYILTHEIFEVLESTQGDKNGEIQITDALMTLAKIAKLLGASVGVGFSTILCTR